MKLKCPRCGSPAGSIEPLQKKGPWSVWLPKRCKNRACHQGFMMRIRRVLDVEAEQRGLPLGAIDVEFRDRGHAEAH